MPACKYAANGHSELFHQLKIVLTERKGAVSAAALAEQSGKTKNPVHEAVHRLRKRYREILEDRIGSSAPHPGLGLKAP